MLLMYEFAIRLLTLGIHIAAIFNNKARHWVQGRANWREHLKSRVNGQKSKVLWLHAASLGEFEQGRPIIEAFRAQFPNWKIVLTFFSPSGYEIRKDYPPVSYTHLDVYKRQV